MPSRRSGPTHGGRGSSTSYETCCSVLSSSRGRRSPESGNFCSTPVSGKKLHSGSLIPRSEISGFASTRVTRPVTRGGDAPLQNKIGTFLANPTLRQILSADESSFDLRAIMDSGKVLLVNLSKGRIGGDASALLRALLVSHVELAAISRVDVPEESRSDFYTYLDEFQSYATASVASTLPELRKYRVVLALANQHLAQLDDDVCASILGNVGTTVVFRVGVFDAEILEREFAPEISGDDMVNLPPHEFYIKPTLGGVASRPFSGTNITWSGDSPEHFKS